ncbi:hypothetical protein [Streptomyces sp. NPDC058989]|uniref:hypothetical protein n=1 Tax=Streptomyces sp. NPDC058989 TaxID=3346686 RepID=UPI003693628B
MLPVEEHRRLSPFWSRLVNVRSMENFRRLGPAASVTAATFAPEYGRIRFRDTLYDRDFATAAMVGINAPVPESPVLGVVTSQDRWEPTLLAAADAPVRFGVEAAAASTVMCTPARGSRTRPSSPRGARLMPWSRVWDRISRSGTF